MPSWSIRYAGALNDQQINDIVNYIISIQDESIVTEDKNVCTNPEAQTAAVEEFLDGNLADKPLPDHEHRALMPPRPASASTIPCETLIKGGLTTIMAFILFVGSPLLLLSAVFGRRMGYLVLAVAFFGWMIILSAIWTFGFYSQGPSTPVDLGPRGAEPAWVVEAAGTEPEATYPVFDQYPDGEGVARTRRERQRHRVGAGRHLVGAELPRRAGERGASGSEKDEPGAYTTTDFTIENVRFATRRRRLARGAPRATTSAAARS